MKISKNLFINDINDYIILNFVNGDALLIDNLDIFDNIV